MKNGEWGIYTFEPIRLSEAKLKRRNEFLKKMREKLETEMKQRGQKRW